MSAPATTRQEHWRFYDDDNSNEDATTARGSAEDTTHEILLSERDASIHLRVTVGNTGDMSANAAYRLSVDIDGGGFNPVTTTSSNVRVIAGQPTNGAVTSQRLTSGTGSFTAGEYDDADGLIDANLGGGNFWESVWSIEFRSADLTDGESVTFRVQLDSADLDFYDVAIVCTIESGAPADVLQAQVWM